MLTADVHKVKRVHQNGELFKIKCADKRDLREKTYYKCYQPDVYKVREYTEMENFLRENVQKEYFMDKKPFNYYQPARCLQGKRVHQNGELFRKKYIQKPVIHKTRITGFYRFASY
ncbi:hypothetical protein BC359_01245 [Priestia flexa]|nr:hypothetical protein BC359_01245 [Priestia flexa]